MKIEKITLNEYKEFIESNETGYVFLQMPSYASIRSRFILAGKDNTNTITHAIIIEPKTGMRFLKYAYSASSWLTTDHSKDKEFLDDASKWLKTEGYVLWRIESSIEIKEYDKNGLEVDNGFDNKDHAYMMAEAGFKWHKIPRGVNTNYQNTWEMAVELKENITHIRKGYTDRLHKDIPNRDIEDILMTMGSSCRKYMRKAQRDGFTIEVKKPTEMTEEDWQTIEAMIAKSGDYQGFDPNDSGKRRELAEASPENSLLVILRNKEGNPVYGGYWYYTNMEMLCYLGGLDRSGANYNLSSYIHTTMYRKAIEMGLEQYNYGGISGYFEKGEEGYGCYQFKRELGAKVIRTFGVFDKPLSFLGIMYEKKIGKIT